MWALSPAPGEGLQTPCLDPSPALRGRVLPVGGLKEKLLAAKCAKIKTVLVPKENRPDIKELSEEITGGMDILYVESMEEVLEEVLV